MAEELARQAADMYLIGAEPFFGVSTHQLKRELNDWKVKQVASLWRKTPGPTHAKKLVNCSSNSNK